MGCHFRLGLVFSVTDDPAISGRNDAGVAALNLFNYVKDNYDVGQAMQALAKVIDACVVSSESIDALMTWKIID